MNSFKALLIIILSCTLGCAHQPTPSPRLTKNFCSVGKEQIIEKITPPFPPKYFLKPVGAGTEVAYVGSSDVNDQNYLFDLVSKKITAIPGKLDPIGLFGSDLISIPLEDEQGNLSMSFYDLRQLRTNGVATSPLLPSDHTLTGRYQSMGVLKRKGTKVFFRIITDGHSGGEYKDFEVDFASIPAKLKTVQKTKPLCSNLRNRKSEFLNLKLPMISKDAKYYSAFDVKAQTMKVFSLDQFGNCKPTRSPQLERGDIGKLDFSANSEEVAFHYSDRSLDIFPIQFGVPERSWQLRSAVYNFARQTYKILPFSGKNANTYFPAFLPNGNILALEAAEETFQFIIINPTQTKEITKQKLTALHELESKDYKPFVDLSNLWMDECLNEQNSSLRYNRLLMVLSLSKQQCLELAGAQQKLTAICDLL